jgi:DNA-binding transcriptional LysR family regulator
MARMTLRRLEVFVTVVDAGGFRACSDLLDISPAAVSHQVNQLEDELRCELFIRKRGRLCGLTEEGARAYAEAKELLGHADAFETALGGRGKRPIRRVKILADAILETHLAKHIAEFASGHPLLDVSLERSHFEEMIDALGKGKADIAYFYSSGPVGIIDSECVWLEPISICASHDHPVFSLPRVTCRELRQFSFVAPPDGFHFRRSVDTILRRQGLEDYKIALQTGHANVARESVIGRFAISAVITRYLEEELLQHGVRAVPVFEGQLALEVRRAVRRGLVLDRDVSALMQGLNKAAFRPRSTPRPAVYSPVIAATRPKRSPMRSSAISLFHQNAYSKPGILTK